MKANVDNRGASVSIRISGMTFFIDVWIDKNKNLNMDWNQYIFNKTNSIDNKRFKIQNNPTNFINSISKVEAFLFRKKIIDVNDNGEYVFL